MANGYRKGKTWLMYWVKPTRVISRLKFTLEFKQNDIRFDSDNTEDYNVKLSLREHKTAISKSHNTSAGPDDIRCKVLKKFPEATLIILLDILNSVWNSGEFRTSWVKDILG